MNKSVVTLIIAMASLLFLNSAHAGISGSKHDLSSGTTATTEVCVFCHTPHGSDTTASVPLWNKTLPSTTYTRYSALGTSSLDGTEAAIGSVSLACLSCHDGSQARDMVINAPGSGGYNASGSELDAGAIGSMAGTPLPNLEADLRNDHPVSIQYGGGGAVAGDSDGVFAAVGFADPDFNALTKATVNGNPVWWVDSDGDSARDKNEMQLFSRTISGTVQPSVECASCHDPHNDASTGVEFLRGDNTNSDICLACHNK